MAPCIREYDLSASIFLMICQSIILFDEFLSFFWTVLRRNVSQSQYKMIYYSKNIFAFLIVSWACKLLDPPIISILLLPEFICNYKFIFIIIIITINNIIPITIIFSCRCKHRINHFLTLIPIHISSIIHLNKIWIK